MTRMTHAIDSSDLSWICMHAMATRCVVRIQWNAGSVSVSDSATAFAVHALNSVKSLLHITYRDPCNMILS